MASLGLLFWLLLAIGALASHVDAQTCTLYNNVILGADSIATVRATSAAACCETCNANPRCIAFTLDTATFDCFLKDNTNSKTSAASRVSGTNGRAPQPAWSDACTQEGLKDFPFCDTTLPLEKRLDDLVDRILLNESGALLTARESVAIPRLGIPAYYWGTNAIHGLQNLECLSTGQCPTSFPAPCGLAAAFNDTVVRGMGAVLGRELRAYYNNRSHNSLDTWSPTININRDPRWGRNVESPGEDPVVCGRYGAAYTEGLQNGIDPNYVQSVVTLKHWLAYSLERYGGVTRDTYNAIVSDYDLATSYLVAWRIAVQQGKALGVMCSYNMLNGNPTCGDPNITAILREGMGFTGYITSDTDAIADIWATHHYERDAAHATRDGLAAGCDINSGNTYRNNIEAVVQSGLVPLSDVKNALRNSFRMRFLVGLFDNTPSPYKNIPTSVVGQPSHVKLSLDAARQTMVLLKNDHNMLPFDTGRRVAVLGASSNVGGDLLGNYVGPICPDHTTNCVASLFNGIKKINVGGTTTNVYDVSQVDKAVAAAQAADVVVLVLSNAHDGGGEGDDRTTISLAANQHTFATAILKVGRPTVVVLINGGIIALDELADSAPAILEAFMPGVYGAQAVAETIFGLNNPGGKLPVTYYHSNYINEINFLNMSMSAGPGRGYRYYTGSPSFPFGFGLSYTTFELDWSPSPPPRTLVNAPQDNITYTVKVTNTGNRAGTEVVLAFFHPTPTLATALGASLGVPVVRKQLFDYERVFLNAGESVTLHFTTPASAFALSDAAGNLALHPGAYSVLFSRGHGQELRAPVHVARRAEVGHLVPDRTLHVGV